MREAIGAGVVEVEPLAVSPFEGRAPQTESLKEWLEADTTGEEDWDEAGDGGKERQTQLKSKIEE